MFYKLLFLLACYNLYQSGTSFIRANIVIDNGKCAEIATKTYVAAGATILFYVMVMAICILPSILF